MKSLAALTYPRIINAALFALALSVVVSRAEDKPAIPALAPADEFTKLRAENEQLRRDLNDLAEQFRRYRSVVGGNQVRGAVPAVRADRAIVIDAVSGDVLVEKNPDKRGPVASTQKLLTSLLIVESPNIEEYLTVEEPDIDCAPVKIGLKVGETYPRIHLLTALLVKSSNDIAQCLARDNAGTIEAFVDKMNKRAHELGMNDSHFMNPHGLPVENQYSTARDMARLALAVDRNPVIRDITKILRFHFIKADGKTLVLENTNHVLRSSPWCDGMKTGFTEAAGHCLVCSGEKDGRRRIVVVLNDSAASVWTDAQALLEWALRG